MSLLIMSLFVSAGFLHVITGLDSGVVIKENGVNREFSQLSFDQALYFVAVTCASVGYGDYSPENDKSRLITLCMVIMVIFVVTKTTSDFNLIMQVKIKIFNFKNSLLNFFLLIQSRSAFKVPFQFHNK